MTRERHGVEVDTDHLADVLDALATGIRAGDIPITNVTGTHDVEADESGEFELTVRYIVMKGYESTFDPIQYEDDTEGDDA